MSDHKDAERIASALGGHRSGLGWSCHCPAHEDRNPSLSVGIGEDGRILVHCFAGCAQADVIAALKVRQLWPGPRRAHPYSASTAAVPSSRKTRGFSPSAQRIWQKAHDLRGTPAETYLRSRGLDLELPASLRFRPTLRHKTGQLLPAMVAGITGISGNEIVAIHRTFLRADGSGKADVEPQRMMLGPCHGGAVRLGPVADHVLVGEGIETCLSGMQASGIPAWAALSTSGLAALILPADVRRVTILADGDDAGETAARRAAVRWLAEGREVRIARPPRGADFNDVHQGRCAERTGGAA